MTDPRQIYGVQETDWSVATRAECLNLLYKYWLLYGGLPGMERFEPFFAARQFQEML